jgi:hypothetical protein
MEKIKEPQFIVASALILLTFFLDVWVAWLIIAHRDLTNEAIAILSSILAIWHTSQALAGGYWLASSAGSKDKDKQLQALAAAPSGS